MASDQNRFLRRFFQHRMAVLGALMLLAVILFVVIGSILFSEADANRTDLRNIRQAPSTEHPFGTDSIGRSTLVRSIYGGQISMIIGLASVLMSIGIGVSVGAISGYYGGVIDNILMRLVEVMLSVPTLFLLLVMARFFGGRVPEIVILDRVFSGSVIVIIIIIGVTGWTGVARIVRAQFLSLKEQEFVMAARALGVPGILIMLRHILPNTVAPIVVSATLGIAGGILAEAYISFLGLGVQAPTASWGNMLNDAQNYITSAPWMWFFPGTLIVLVSLGINFLGDGLRDALDPRSKSLH